MRFQRAQGLLASTLMWTAAFVIGVGTLAGCSEPDLRTNLRPEGPPDVLTFMVQTDQLTDDIFPVIIEAPSFCKMGDDKLPTIVGIPGLFVTSLQVCPKPGSTDPAPTMVTNADPLAPQVRVVFDELIDPDVEQLLNEDGDECGPTDDACSGTIAATNPVSVTCGGSPVAYDGFYAPNGNNVTWPPGPSLVVTFGVGDIATGAQCQLTVNDNVVDKTGVPVPAEQRGAFGFQFSALALLGSDPEPDDAEPPEVATDGAIALLFNALIDLGSVAATDITVVDGAAAAVAIEVVDDGTALIVAGPGGAWAPGDYTLTVPTGATFADVAGGTLTTGEDYVLAFTVPMP